MYGGIERMLLEPMKVDLRVGMQRMAQHTKSSEQLLFT